MDSPPFDLLGLVARLRESARRGDWNSAAELARILPHQKLPEDPERLGEYLHTLKEALTVAKASRVNAASSLVRLNAAARFNRARLDDHVG